MNIRDVILSVAKDLRKPRHGRKEILRYAQDDILSFFVVITQDARGDFSVAYGKVPTLEKEILELQQELEK